MLDGRSRVTVVGERRRVDVALPSTAPIAEYSASLANLCGQGGRGVTPPAWSLAVAGDGPLSLTTSLADSGVVDGQVLYLRDLTRHPGSEAIVADIEELIAGAADDQRKADWPRSLVVMTLGLLWVAGAALLALRHSSGPVVSAVGLLVAGLLLLGTGWALAQRRVVVPATLCLLTSLTAVPCFAVAGALLTRAVAGDAFFWVGAIAGAAAAVLMIMATTPEAVVVLLGVPLAVAVLVAPLLLLVHATNVQVAATTVVAMLAVLGLSKTCTAFLTLWSTRRAGDSAGLADGATALLIRHRRLLAVLMTVPALSIAVGLPVLAASGNSFALAMAAVASLAVLIRAQQVGFASESVPLNSAGLVGLFAVVAVAATDIWRSDVATTIALLVAGLALIARSTVSMVLRAGGDEVADLPAGFPAGTGRPRGRRRFVDVVGVLCTLATISLALGVFGVYGELVDMGRGIVG
ncbi:type VII secretion integral membrane protein EccD [Rugosimonospora acidiphila]|uniref:Type VII secretion integral membrane protein EccD n=1 Tax=Rugosimonospora acidiphila TaxID=556531 RepID=A0ABP9SNP2_9ACTN